MYEYVYCVLSFVYTFSPLSLSILRSLLFVFIIIVLYYTQFEEYVRVCLLCFELCLHFLPALSPSYTLSSFCVSHSNSNLKGKQLERGGMRANIRGGGLKRGKGKGGEGRGKGRGKGRKGI